MYRISKRTSINEPSTEAPDSLPTSQCNNSSTLRSLLRSIFLSSRHTSQCHTETMIFEYNSQTKKRMSVILTIFTAHPSRRDAVNHLMGDRVMKVFYQKRNLIDWMLGNECKKGSCMV